MAMRTDVIALVSTSVSIDTYGDQIVTETPRVVFAEPMSVGQKEFYQAAAVGLQPELKFRLSDYLDYGGEKIVLHYGVRYRVLRAYRTGNELELVVYREVNPPEATA